MRGASAPAHAAASGSVAGVPEEPFSRRVLLGGATALLLGGCEGDPSGTPTPSQGSSRSKGSDAPAPTGDEQLVTRALRSAARLAAAYRTLAARHPETRSLARPLRAHLLEHLTAFGGTEQATAPVRSSLRDALDGLLAQERAASQGRAEDAVVAESADLARTLASVAAAHAQHVVVLERFRAR